MSLPYNIFFSPTDEFLEWAKGYIRTKLVIDCGAGVGHLTLRLKEHNINALPIDLHRRDEMDSYVMTEDSTIFPFPPRSVAIIARPNRGLWIRKTIDHALKTSDVVLYIGIEKHFDEDIVSLQNTYNVKTLFEKAGKENECVFEITRKDKEMSKKTTYCLVKYKMCKNITSVSWFKDGRDRWNNYMGGYCPKSDGDKVLQTCEAEDIHDLDWTLTDILREDSASGWVDRDGRFYGCGSQMHDLVADLILDKTPKELEGAGWVRIYHSKEWICFKQLSAGQRNTLLKKGHALSADNGGDIMELRTIGIEDD